MSTSRDPQGKRALFTVTEEGSAARAAPPSGGAEGKTALFSTATRRLGTLVVECSSCNGRSRVSYLDFTTRQLPYTAWTPWRRHSRLMKCPACDKRTWMAAHWLE
ncbi:MAG: hypothetical protein JOZ99_16525 [Actinobacteria bacterium]|nr:hypothetical protein [Actinomycetota bacterium]